MLFQTSTLISVALLAVTVPAMPHEENDFPVTRPVCPSPYVAPFVPHTNDATTGAY
jgi:hypothetical protein